MYLVAAGRNWETWSWSRAGGEATGQCCWVQPPRNSLVCQFASMAVCMVLWKSGKSELYISSIFLCIHLSICLFACLPIYSPDIFYHLNFLSWSWVWFHFESRRSTFRPNVLKQLPLFNLSIYRSIYLSIYQSINQLTYLSVYLPIHVSI